MRTGMRHWIPNDWICNGFIRFAVAAKWDSLHTCIDKCFLILRLSQYLAIQENQPKDMRNTSRPDTGEETPSKLARPTGTEINWSEPPLKVLGSWLENQTTMVAKHQAQKIRKVAASTQLLVSRMTWSREQGFTMHTTREGACYSMPNIRCSNALSAVACRWIVA